MQNVKSTNGLWALGYSLQYNTYSTVCLPVCPIRVYIRLSVCLLISLPLGLSV